MPIYKNNIIFIHIPKTGGTYIEKQLENYTSQKLFGYSPKLNAYLQHCYYSEYKYMIKNVDDCICFSIIRNPYDRLYSAYKQKFNKQSDIHLIKMMESNNFKDFVMNKLENILHNTSEHYKFNGNVRHISKQVDFIKPSDNIKLFLYENMSDITDFLNKYDIWTSIVFNNKSETYITHYDEEMILKMEHIYKDDMIIYSSLRKENFNILR